MLSQCQRQPSAALSDASVNDNKTLNKPIHCYICKEPYTQVHFFYHLLCPKCAAFNYQKRNQHIDLSNRVALVTGGRIKIGYQTALQMLRDGAKVIVTTRFPQDAVRRYSSEANFTQWRDRLHIYGLDLRNIPAVEAFVRHLLDNEPALDIIINNAAQTIKRPRAFYQHLLEQELQPQEALTAEAQNLIPYGTFHHPFLLEDQPQYQDRLRAATSAYFPANTFDAKALWLNVNHLGDAGAGILANALRENQTLVELGVASNGIASEGGIALIQAIQGHPTLTHLDFGYSPSTRVLNAQPNSIGDVGAEAIGKFLRSNQTLLWLNLLFNGITECGKAYLVAGLEQNTKLYQLVLDGKQDSRIMALLERNRTLNPSSVPPIARDLALIRSVYRTA